MYRMYNIFKIYGFNYVHLFCKLLRKYYFLSAILYFTWYILQTSYKVHMNCLYRKIHLYKEPWIHLFCFYHPFCNKTISLERYKPIPHPS